MNIFEEVVKKLNKQQKQAVTTIEGPVIVHAGPGTGKTFLLIARVAYILSRADVNPENILVLTFTDSAVQELRERLINMIGPTAYRVSIFTFHGLANNLIQDYPDSFEQIAGFESASQLEQIECIEQLLFQHPFNVLKPLGNPSFYIRPILQAISQLKQETVSPSELQSFLTSEREGIILNQEHYHQKGKYKGTMMGMIRQKIKSIDRTIELASVYEMYQRALLEKKRYDFDDMIIEMIKILSTNSGFKLLLQETYQYILVDEHQDTNSAQNSIVDLLGDFYENPNIFVVGDEKQAIYRFQGASIENFLSFKTRYPFTKIINLIDNYRSSNVILTVSTQLIRHNKEYQDNHPTKLIARNNMKESSVLISDYSTIQQQYVDVAMKIKSYIKNSKVNVAVLARRNSELVAMQDILNAEGIKAHNYSQKNLFEQPSIRMFFAILEMIQQFPDDVSFVQCLYYPFFSIEPLEIFELLEVSRKDRISIFKLLDNNKKYKSISKVYEMISTLKQRKDMMRFDHFVLEIFDTTGINKYFMNQEDNLYSIHTVNELFSVIRSNVLKYDNYSLDTFLQEIQSMKEHGVSVSSKSNNFDNNQVHLLTAHKSKGQEFDAVFILNCNNSNWGRKKNKSFFYLPWSEFSEVKNILPEEADIDEERRLFYVAMTRAKRYLYLNYAHSDGNGKLIPSQFLSEIDDPRIQRQTHVLNDDTLKHVFEITTKPLKSTPSFEEFKAYCVRLFLSQGLSPTALNNFLDCPWRYFFQNLIRIPETKSNQLLYGTAIHQAISQFIQVKSRKKDTGKSFLLDAFEKALIKEYISKTDIDVWLQKGKDSMSHFYANTTINWNAHLLSENKIPLVPINKSSDIRITGKIDLIYRESLKNNHVKVYDFKTGKPKSRNDIAGLTKSSNGNYKRQIVFYKLLIDKYYQGNMHVNSGIIEFIEPSLSGIHIHQEFEITKDDITELEELIKDVAQKIKTFSFWDETCNDEEYKVLRQSLHETYK